LAGRPGGRLAPPITAVAVSHLLPEFDGTWRDFVIEGRVRMAATAARLRSVTGPSTAAVLGKTTNEAPIPRQAEGSPGSGARRSFRLWGIRHLRRVPTGRSGAVGVQIGFLCPLALRREWIFPVIEGACWSSGSHGAPSIMVARSRSLDRNGGSPLVADPVGMGSVRRS
jgi:hypothetical protein